MAQANMADQAPSIDELEQKLLTLLAKKLNVEVEQLQPEVRFIDDLGADSLDMLELLLDLEDEFKVTIPQGVAGQMKTVGQAFEYVRQWVSRP